MKTTHYRANDRRNGYTAAEVYGIIGRHTRQSTIKIVTGFRGQVQQIIMSEPELAGPGFDLGQIEDENYDPCSEPDHTPGNACATGPTQGHVAGRADEWREYTEAERKAAGL